GRNRFMRIFQWLCLAGLAVQNLCLLVGMIVVLMIVAVQELLSNPEDVVEKVLVALLFLTWVFYPLGMLVVNVMALRGGTWALRAMRVVGIPHALPFPTLFVLVAGVAVFHRTWAAENVEYVLITGLWALPCVMYVCAFK